MYGFDENDQRVSVDGRPKRIKKYADLNENVLVWTAEYAMKTTVWSRSNQCIYN